MRKICSFFLVFFILFLTGCHSKPPVDSGDASSSTDLPKYPISENSIVRNLSSNGEFIQFPSRVAFQMHLTSGQTLNVYYSKVDGKVYVYCYDPLCDHSDEKCFASQVGHVTIEQTRFINGRFYGMDAYNGKIYSFDFDGTDMKLVYESEYLPGEIPNGVWESDMMAYGAYLYIVQRADAEGSPHNLRFNIETKQMEDLTQKTGNYVSPQFFYHDEIYAYNDNNEPVKTNLELTVCEATEDFELSAYFSGSTFIYNVHDEKWNTVGIGSYNVETGERKQIANEALGIPDGSRAMMMAIDKEYIYYCSSNRVLAGYRLHPKTGQKIAVYKYDGKIYRAEHDGTNAVCIYNDPDMDYDINRATAFDGNTIIIYGNLYRSIAGDTEGLIEEYDSGYYVGTISEDGKIDELKLVEIVA